MNSNHWSYICKLGSQCAHLMHVIYQLIRAAGILWLNIWGVFSLMNNILTLFHRLAVNDNKNYFHAPKHSLDVKTGLSYLMQIEQWILANVCYKWLLSGLALGIIDSRKRHTFS